jgi:phosphoglycolate phosphatase-like HAD superfamily hydrolase
VTDLSVLNGATIAFDLDGTLVESAPDLIGAGDGGCGDGRDNHRTIERRIKVFSCWRLV